MFKLTLSNSLLCSLATVLFQLSALAQVVGYQSLACQFHASVKFLLEKQSSCMQTEQFMGCYTALPCQHEGYSFIFWAICTPDTCFSPGLPSPDGEFHPSGFKTAEMIPPFSTSPNGYSNVFRFGNEKAYLSANLIIEVYTLILIFNSRKETGFEGMFLSQIKMPTKTRIKKNHNSSCPLNRC